MAEETELSFAHFIDAELLEARVADFHGDYDAETLAATAFYFGVLALTGMTRLVPVYGDAHALMHVLANVYAGEWLTEMVTLGGINPTELYSHVMAEYGAFLNGTPDGTEDIKSDVSPMDADTFTRLWGRSA